MEQSWAEQRAYITAAVDALGISDLAAETYAPSRIDAGPAKRQAISASRIRPRPL